MHVQVKFTDLKFTVTARLTEHGHAKYTSQGVKSVSYWHGSQLLVGGRRGLISPLGAIVPTGRVVWVGRVVAVGCITGRKRKAWGRLWGCEDVRRKEEIIKSSAHVPTTVHD